MSLPWPYQGTNSTLSLPLLYSLRLLSSFSTCRSGPSQIPVIAHESCQSGSHSSTESLYTCISSCDERSVCHSCQRVEKSPTHLGLHCNKLPTSLEGSIGSPDAFTCSRCAVEFTSYFTRIFSSMFKCTHPCHVLELTITVFKHERQSLTHYFR